MRRLLGLTWMGWLNFLVLQWLFVRVARRLPFATTDYYVSRGRLYVVRYVLPLTGWVSPLVYVWRRQ